MKYTKRNQLEIDEGKYIFTLCKCSLLEGYVLNLQGISVIREKPSSTNLIYSIHTQFNVHFAHF